MFKEGLALHGIAPVSIRHCWPAPQPGPFLGAARRWLQTPNRMPAEKMAARIETMVSPIRFGASE